MWTPSSPTLGSFDELDTFFTGAVGLAILVVASYTFSKVRLSRTLHQKNDNAGTTGLHVPTTNGWRQKEPNFGYKDSCKGTSLKVSRYTPEGLEYDRVWCIIDAETHAAVTAREVPKMVLITPEIVHDATSPYGGILEVTFPADSDCASFSVPLEPTEDVLKGWQPIDNVSMWEDSIDGYICENPTVSISETLSRFMGRAVHLAFKGKKPRNCAATTAFPDLRASAKYQDGYPWLVFSEESIDAINEEVRGRIGQQGIDEKWKTENVVVERFRPNIVFSGGGPFAEDNWKEIAIGPDIQSAEKAPRILVVSNHSPQNVQLPNVSPETGIRDKAVPYKVLMKFRMGVDPENKWKPSAGCNAVPMNEGIVRVGDVVSVKALV
ncbi:hypothetical protein V5O48_002746 [Marasmius crinis-equi]|uniref:MOSC domain-containing protein n=1 Tax=Marasmius crinis-equi TaxID=585013 RepID=A0ABR3FUQ2_9AGAR